MRIQHLVLAAAAGALALGCANYNSLSTCAGDSPAAPVAAAYESFHQAFPDGSVIDISAGGLSLQGDALSADLTVPGVMDIDQFEAERVSDLFKKHAVRVAIPLMVNGVETLNLTLRHSLAKKQEPGGAVPEAVPASLTLSISRYMVKEWQRDPGDLVKFFDLIVGARGVTLDGKLVSSALR